ncbi:MAG: hypothetical protein FD181_3341 [Prolixibacteraceae bacterium]|nr:MAG: hypothetical protein FD181_3341 [Prolixibacteraceae bacterium]
MQKRGYLIILFAVIVAFWQLVFLQNGMKWDFVDAFLPSRYFFSESVLNNQFPLWNPYLLYGTPIYADLVSVFNPEFWIIGNMFGYSNITLQFVFLAYIFLAGVSFFYFLKQFKADVSLSVGLSVAYMLSGFTIGNSQHVAFVCGYALIPFLIACYYQFIREINKINFVRLSVALFLMIYCSYPALTIISGYFLLCIFIRHLITNRTDKIYIKKSAGYHFALLMIVILFSSTLILAYFQISPFLSRFNGLPVELAQKHPFSVKSLLSFLVPMAAGNDPQFFKTDVSFSNGYWGIISLALFLFVFTKRAVQKESYLILFFGFFALLASFGDQFFVRGLLYKFAPLMDRFQYPGMFRAFAIFGFLAFTGINFKYLDFSFKDRKRIMLISASIIAVLLILIIQANSRIENFAYFKNSLKFSEELFTATRYDNIIFQGIIQVVFLSVLILITWKIKTVKYFSAALLFLFIADGIVSTQLSAHYTVLSKHSPVEFYKYLKSSPKGFPVPDLNPIEENSDRNAANEFTWMNNNVFPKKVTFDGLVSFKTDGYRYLSDNHPNLLEAIKKGPVVYFSDDVREDGSVRDFKTNTVFVQTSDYKKLTGKTLRSGKYDELKISGFSPRMIEIKTSLEFPQLLIYQQNYYNGWRVYINGIEQDLIKTNFAHMSVLVPEGEHSVRFEYSNLGIILMFCFTSLIFLILIALSVKYYIVRYPERRKQVIIYLASGFLIFVLASVTNRYFYHKNKLGLTPLISEKVEKWKSTYNDNIRILLSTKHKELTEMVNADAVCFINEKNNVAELSDFLMDSRTEYFAFAWQGGIIGDELFELIYSFYPEIIEQKKRNNSGFILLDKGTKQLEYKFIRTFEPDNSAVWIQNSTRIKKDSVSGNHTYFYTEKDEFGTSVEFVADSDLITSKKITILADFKIEEKLTEVLLVFTTDRAGELKIYQVSKINQFARYPDKWGRTVFDVKITPEIQEGDNIKIYFWNNNKANFEIDNLRIKIGKS